MDAAGRLKQIAPLSVAERKRRRAQQSLNLDAALAAWVEKRSSENTHLLYRAACAYLGVRPVVVDEDDECRTSRHLRSHFVISSPHLRP